MKAENSNAKKIQEAAQNFYDDRSDKSFKVLYDILYPLFYNVVRRYYIKNDNDLIKDVLSKTFMIIYKRIGNHDGERPFFAYFYTILVNESLGELKKKSLMTPLSRLNAKKDVAKLFQNVEDEYDYMNIEENQEKLEIIVDVIKKLDYEHADLVIDKYLHGYKNPELLEKYGLDSLQTIKNWSHQGKKQEDQENYIKHKKKEMKQN